MTNVERIREVYEAFGRGDVPAILEHLAEDVEWEYGLVSTDVPWLQPRKGRAGVAEFFRDLTAIEFRHFEPKVFLQEGDVVVVLVDLEATVVANGRQIDEEDEAHIWYFDAEGKVSRFRHRVDTHQQQVAFAGG